MPALQEKPAAISRVFPPISQIILRYRSRSDPAFLTPLTRRATGVHHSTRCPKIAGLPWAGLVSHGVPRVSCQTQPRLSQTKNDIDASTGPPPPAAHPLPHALQPRIATVFSLPSVLAYPTPSFFAVSPFSDKASVYSQAREGTGPSGSMVSCQPMSWHHTMWRTNGRFNQCRGSLSLVSHWTRQQLNAYIVGDRVLS